MVILLPPFSPVRAYRSSVLEGVISASKVCDDLRAESKSRRNQENRDEDISPTGLDSPHSLLRNVGCACHGLERANPLREQRRPISLLPCGNAEPGAVGETVFQFALRLSLQLGL